MGSPVGTPTLPLLKRICIYKKKKQKLMDWCHHLVPTSVGMGRPLALGICWRLCNFISQVALQHTTAHTVYENNLISYHQNTTLVLQIQYTPTIRTKSDTFNQQAKTTIQRGLWLVSMIKLPSLPNDSHQATFLTRLM